EQEFLLADAQYGDAHPGRRNRADLHLRSDALEKGIRRVVEGGHLAPGILVGMARAPVVIFAAWPAIHRHAFAIHHQLAGEGDLRAADNGLCPWQTCRVEILRQEQDAAVVALVGQGPFDAVTVQVGATMQLVIAQRTVADMHLQAVAGELAAVERKLLLDGHDPVFVAVEPDRPDLTERLAFFIAGNKARITDPERLRLVRMVAAQEPGFVMALRLRGLAAVKRNHCAISAWS